MSASSDGHLDLVRVLINEGCDINAQDKNGISVFGHALTSSKGDNIGLINLLIEAGVDTKKGKFEWKNSQSLENSETEYNPIKKFYLKPEKNKKNNLNNNKPEKKSYFKIHQMKKTYSKKSKNVKADSKFNSSLQKLNNYFNNDSISISIKRGFEEIAIKLLEKDVSVINETNQLIQNYMQLAIMFKAWKVIKFFLVKGIKPEIRELEKKEKWNMNLDEETRETLEEMVDTHFICKKSKNKKSNNKNNPFLKTNNFSESNKTTSSKGGGYLLSQLTLDPDSCGNKLLNEISVKSSSETRTSKLNEFSCEEYLRNTAPLEFDTQFLLKKDPKIEKRKRIREKLEKEIKQLEIELFELENKNLKCQPNLDFQSLNSNERKNDILDIAPKDDSFLISKINNKEETNKNNANQLLDIISSKSNTSFQPEIITTNSNTINQMINCQNCLNFTKNINIHKKPEKFEKKLGQDVLNFVKEVDKIHQCTKHHYYYVKLLLENVIQNIYKKPFNLEIFGSFANGFNLPGADLDLLLILDKNESKNSEGSKKELKAGHKYSDSLIFDNNFTADEFPEISQNDYHQKFYNEKLLDEINDKISTQKQIFKESIFLRNAQFPVLKMKTEDKLGCFPVDITIKDNKHRGLECVKLVLEFHKKYPPLKPLCLIIKQILNCAYLSDPYKGGIGSYGVVLMIVAYFQFLETNLSNGNYNKDLQNNFQQNLNSNYEFDFLNPKSTTNKKINGRAFSSEADIESFSSNNKASPYLMNPENIGCLLLGILHFYGFQFDPYRMFIRVYKPKDKVEYPFVEVRVI